MKMSVFTKMLPSTFLWGSLSLNTVVPVLVLGLGLEGTPFRDGRPYQPGLPRVRVGGV